MTSETAVVNTLYNLIGDSALKAIAHSFHSFQHKFCVIFDMNNVVCNLVNFLYPNPFQKCSFLALIFKWNRFARIDILILMEKKLSVLFIYFSEVAGSKQTNKEAAKE